MATLIDIFVVDRRVQGCFCHSEQRHILASDWLLIYYLLTLVVIRYVNRYANLHKRERISLNDSYFARDTLKDPMSVLVPQTFIFFPYLHHQVLLSMLLVDVKYEMLRLDDFQEQLTKLHLPLTVIMLQAHTIIGDRLYSIINPNAFLALIDVLALHQQAEKYLLELMWPALHHLRHRFVLLDDDLQPRIVHLAVLHYFGHLLFRAERLCHWIVAHTILVKVKSIAREARQELKVLTTQLQLGQVRQLLPLCQHMLEGMQIPLALIQWIFHIIEYRPVYIQLLLLIILFVYKLLHFRHIFHYY